MSSKISFQIICLKFSFIKNYWHRSLSFSKLCRVRQASLFKSWMNFSSQIILGKWTNCPSVQEDDVLYHWTILEAMQKSMIGVPFKAGHEIHVSTFQLFIQTLSSHGRLVVYIYMLTHVGLVHEFSFYVSLNFLFPTFSLKFYCIYISCRKLLNKMLIPS